MEESNQKSGKEKQNRAGTEPEWELDRHGTKIRTNRKKMETEQEPNQSGTEKRKKHSIGIRSGMEAESDWNGITSLAIHLRRTRAGLEWKKVDNQEGSLTSCNRPTFHASRCDK